MQIKLKQNQGLASLLTSALDILLPPRCAGTGDVVDEQGMLSPSFWGGLGFIEAPFCTTCGTPFGFENALGMICAACMEHEPEFDQARAPVVYNDASRQLILDFKHGDKMHFVHTFMPWMLRAGAELIEQADAVIPVPLHNGRLWKRRYNQSAVLAAELVKRTGKLHLPDGLIRLRATVQQKGLSRKERRDNVKGAFAVNGRYMNELRGKNILLVDDVFTSGATLHECARTLKKHGAEKIFVLTIARVTREEF